MAVFFHLRLLCSGIKESYIVLWYFQFLSHCSIAMCSCVRSRASVPYGPCSRPATLLYCENVSWYVSVYLILSFNLVLCIFHGFNLMLRLTTSKARPFSKTSHRQGTMWHGPAPCRVFWTMCFYVVFLISLIASQGPFQRRVTHRLGHMACCRYTPTKHTFHEWPRTLLLRLWFLNQTSLVLKKWNNQWSKN